MELNALENVALPMIMDGRNYKTAASLMELVSIGNRVSHMPNELSGGQQQRVAIARALANKPAILLANLFYTTNNLLNNPAVLKYFKTEKNYAPLPR